MHHSLRNLRIWESVGVFDLFRKNAAEIPEILIKIGANVGKLENNSKKSDIIV